jgi:hypothetical protein
MRTHATTVSRSSQKAALLRSSSIVRKIHRLRAIPSGLVSPDRTVRSWSNTRIMTDNNPFTAWEVIDFKLWELRELAFEEAML